jgi:hypothetical protein
MRSLLVRPDVSEQPVDVGQRSEAAILTELLKRGYRVLQPLGPNHRYDLVIDTGERFVKVQCKTGRLRNGVVKFRCCSIRSNTQQVLIRDYRREIDLFMVYCPDLDRVYAVPVDDVGISECALRVDPTANWQERGIRWAADYELPA